MIKDDENALETTKVKRDETNALCRSHENQNRFSKTPERKKNVAQYTQHKQSSKRINWKVKYNETEEQDGNQRNRTKKPTEIAVAYAMMKTHIAISCGKLFRYHTKLLNNNTQFEQFKHTAERAIKWFRSAAERISFSEFHFVVGTHWGAVHFFMEENWFSGFWIQL